MDNTFPPESENEINNQPLTEDMETHDTTTVISQEKLRGIVIPQTPKTYSCDKYPYNTTKLIKTKGHIHFF